ncbi:hypothetical protein [Streptomyces albidus (ex Kaewkla and Franco 2022)]|uniref:hypothetical protein n=1 Tax=Streptomyces albidus (ex Kaewkla and Franco 2022) TaxID=722709 RepID=UPI0015EFB4D7|nr:hypothetical protein [Streptomyces albidus (ex Kaewkla and Franco 2022)]
MTDTVDPSLLTDPGPLSPRDEARLAHVGTLLGLVEAALKQVPVTPDPDTEPGALLSAALQIKKRAAQLVSTAVVAERERGTSYAVLGHVAGMSRQSAHTKWAKELDAWARTGRTRKPPENRTPLQVAVIYEPSVPAWTPCGCPAPRARTRCAVSGPPSSTSSEPCCSEN